MITRKKLILLPLLLLPLLSISQTGCKARRHRATASYSRLYRAPDDRLYARTITHNDDDAVIFIWWYLVLSSQTAQPGVGTSGQGTWVREERPIEEVSLVPTSTVVRVKDEEPTAIIVADDKVPPQEIVDEKSSPEQAEEAEQAGTETLESMESTDSNGETTESDSGSSDSGSSDSGSGGSDSGGGGDSGGGDGGSGS